MPARPPPQAAPQVDRRPAPRRHLQMDHPIGTDLHHRTHEVPHLTVPTPRRCPAGMAIPSRLVGPVSSADAAGPGHRRRPAPRRAARSGWRQPGSLAHARRRGDNAGMAGDDSRAPSPLRWALMRHLDGARSSRTSMWVQAVAPVVTQAAAGAGHWAAGRRQRALAEWAGAAGFGLVAWGLGTEAPTPAEVQENFRRQLDLMRKPGTPAPVPAGTETPPVRRLSPCRSRIGSPAAGSIG